MARLHADRVPQAGVSAPVRQRAVPATPQPTPPQGASNQALLRALGIQARLTVSQPGDPDEQDAERAADAFAGGRRAPDLAAHASGAIQRQCTACADDSPLARKSAPGGAGTPRVGPVRAALGASTGYPLAPDLQRSFERFFNTGLDAVRVHTDAPAQQAADALSARAFARGTDIYFGRGAFDPGTSAGRHLVAHELAHTVQQQAAGGAGERLQRECSVSGPPRADPDTERVVAAIRTGSLDIETVVASMRGKGLQELCAMRAAVQDATGQRLERWMVVVANVASLHDLRQLGGAAEEGLRLLLPALPLIDRLELYDESDREIEQAQLDLLRHSSIDERAALRSEAARLDAIYARMGIREEYEARLLVSPQEKYAAAEHVLARARHWLWFDDEDPVFDAIWALAPAERRRFVDGKGTTLRALLSGDSYNLLRTLATGTEAEALVARLRLATEGRSDDMQAVQAVVDRAVALLAEQRGLRQTVARAGLPADELSNAQARLAELGELETLVRFNQGRLDSSSFLGRLADAGGSADAFGAMARQLGTAVAPEQQEDFALATARQRILMSDGDEDEVRNALLQLRAPPVPVDESLRPWQRDLRQTEANAALRRRLLALPDVHNVITGMVGSQQMRVLSFVEADALDEKMADLTLALNGARWGEFFQIVLDIAQRPDWKFRFEATADSPFSTFARVHGEQRRVMLEILRTERMPASLILQVTGDTDTLRQALSRIDETERSRLRLGYLLARTGRQPAGEVEVAALAAYREFEAQLRRSQAGVLSVDAGGVEEALDAALGSEPTQEEMATDEGKYNAAALMYERIEARLALGRGLSASFTEADETMVAAGRQFAAMWAQMRDRQPRCLNMFELGALTDLYNTFIHRREEFAEASNAVSEMAGMIAATIAGVIIVAATGGTTAPAVIAAAAAGGTARVVTREMFGEDYYDPANEGMRDALLGAIDGALAVAGAALGARGARLVGLGGEAFISGAARLGGEVAEEAGAVLAQRAAQHAGANMVRRVGGGAVEAAIDGAFSGFVSEAANVMTDSRTWRRGIWRGLVMVGQSAVSAGLVGLGGGALVGAAAPVVGRGARAALEHVAGLRLEAILERAGAGEALRSARLAARSGNVAEADRLLAQLEVHLNAEQAALLRRRLAAEFEASLRHPTGRAALTPEEARILAETASVEGSLGQAASEAEQGIVARSDPQPSTAEGYIDEVDLGNGHTWRRKADGTWCRFTSPSMCGTRIPGAPSWVRGPAPRYRTRRYTLATLPRDSAGNLEPLPHNVIYEFPGGHRIWREANGIRHDTVIGASTGRAHLEREYLTARETELIGLSGTERAHALGQGTGFESPFGIYYAPRMVNQELQNRGVEDLLRRLRDTVGPGRRVRLSTITSPHFGTLRLREVRYAVSLEGAAGQPNFLFEYVIRVDPAGGVTHGVTSVDPAFASHASLVPDNLRARFASPGTVQ